MAAIRPGGREKVWALPKGLVGKGEPPADTALREVTEETGVRGRLVEKLGDVRYVYSWEGERVFKIVSFYLVRYSAGRLGDITDEFRHEVAEARWLPLEDAPRLLTYKGEREMAAKALQLIGERAV
jgi:8-oxo-dGTP pyrophosphatase MutT (NUDIX family)